MVKTQGIPGSIAWIKRRRQEYLKFLSLPTGSPEAKPFRNRLINHFGRSQARVLLKKRAPVIRMVLTALTSLRSFTQPVKVDISSVIGPFIGTDTSSWKPFVTRFWQVLKRSGKVPPAKRVL